MAEAFGELQAQEASADLSHAEWLGLLVDREIASRETKRFEARMRSARLRHVGACPEDVDYRARRGLDKALFQSLLTGRWITDKRNLCSATIKVRIQRQSGRERGFGGAQGGRSPTGEAPNPRFALNGQV